MGDLMYRNAVKVLIADSDSELFALSRPVSYSPFGYIIVHKMLVLDRWLASRKVESVKECVKRLRLEGAESSLIDAVVYASEEDEEEEDIYVVINRSMRSLPSSYKSQLHSSKNEGSDAVIEAKELEST